MTISLLRHFYSASHRLLYKALISHNKSVCLSVTRWHVLKRLLINAVNHVYRLSFDALHANAVHIMATTRHDMQ